MIQNNRPTTGATGPMLNRAQAVVPAAGAQPPQPNVAALAQAIMGIQGRIEAALKAGKPDEAKQVAAEGVAIARQAATAVNDPQLKAGFAEAEQAFAEVGRQIDQAAKSQPKPKKKRKGLFGFVGGLVHGAGKLLEKVGHVVFFPLEMAGKLLDPLRSAVGKVLGGAKDLIDNTLGKIPIIGSAVRFTTGLTASLVGMVDGALQAVTHPVELIKGLGSMAWTLMGVLPPFFNLRTAYDVAVNGKSPVESAKDALGEGGALLKGLVSGALEDFSKGNIAGGLGRLVGDIGTFIVTDGAGAAIKGVGTAGKLAETAKASSVGMKAMKLVEAAKASSAGAKAAQLLEAAKASTLGVKATELAGTVKASKFGTKASEAAHWLNTTGVPKYMEATVNGMRFVNHLGGEIFIKGLKFNRGAWRAVAKHVPHADSVIARFGKVASKGGEIAAKAGKGYLRYLDGVWTTTKKFVPGAERAEAVVKKAMADSLALKRAEEVLDEVKNGGKVEGAPPTVEETVRLRAEKADPQTITLREPKTVTLEGGRSAVSRAKRNMAEKLPEGGPRAIGDGPAQLEAIGGAVAHKPTPLLDRHVDLPNGLGRGEIKGVLDDGSVVVRRIEEIPADGIPRYFGEPVVVPGKDLFQANPQLARDVLRGQPVDVSSLIGGRHRAYIKDATANGTVYVRVDAPKGLAGRVKEKIIKAKIDQLFERNPHLIQQAAMEFDSHLVRMNGIEYRLHTPKGLDPQLFDASKIADQIGHVLKDHRPDAISGLNDIFIHPGSSPADAYWQVVYNNPNHISAATAGSGVINFFHATDNIGQSVLDHELGHIAGEKFNSVYHKYPDGWQEIFDGPEPKVSAYAANNPAEDFAEAFREYLQNRRAGSLDQFRREYPQRASVFDHLFDQL